MLFLCANVVAGKAQSREEILSYKALSQTAAAKPAFQIAQNNANEIQWTLSHLFLFYKYYISSQDGSHCTFSPSCSEYALMAIKKRGLIMGAIDFFDRFQRCNTLSPEQYSVDKRSLLLYDPPF